MSEKLQALIAQNTAAIEKEIARLEKSLQKLSTAMRGKSGKELIQLKEEQQHAVSMLDKLRYEVGE